MVFRNDPPPPRYSQLPASDEHELRDLSQGDPERQCAQPPGDTKQQRWRKLRLCLELDRETWKRGTQRSCKVFGISLLVLFFGSLAIIVFSLIFNGVKLAIQSLSW